MLDAGSQVLGFGVLGGLGLELPAPRHPALTLKTQYPKPKTKQPASSTRHPTPKPLDQALKINVQPPNLPTPCFQLLAPKIQDPKPTP